MKSLVEIYGWALLITWVISTLYYIFDSFSLKTLDYIFSGSNFNRNFSIAYMAIVVFQIFSISMDHLTLVDSVRSKNKWDINLGGKIESGIGLDEDERALRASIDCRTQLYFLNGLFFLMIQFIIQWYF